MISLHSVLTLILDVPLGRAQSDAHLYSPGNFLLTYAPSCSLHTKTGPPKATGKCP